MTNYPFLEIEQLDQDSFLKVAETLTRMGIKSTKDGKNVLWQSCHVLHKQGRYYITHFKEMFLLDGKQSKTEIDETDIERRNLIALNLQAWGLIKLISKVDYPESNINLTIVKYSEKDKYELNSKYNIGNRK